MWLAKTDVNGELLWNHTYGGFLNVAYDLVQTSDGGFALAGLTYPFGAPFSDMWLVKTDASGIEQWNQTYGGLYDDFANALVQTADGGFALAGGRQGAMYLVKTESISEPNGGSVPSFTLFSMIAFFTVLVLSKKFRVSR